MTTPQRTGAAEVILIFRIGSLGDTVMALPCFHKVARVFPHRRRVVISDIPASQKASSVEGVLGNSGLIHEVIYFPPAPRSRDDFLALRAGIRHTRAKTLIYLADRELLPTLRDLYFFRFCGLRQIIGAPLSKALRTAQVDPATGIAESEAQRLARCITSLGQIDLDDPAMWDLRLQPGEWSLAEKALAPVADRRFVAVNIGGKIAIKDWGDHNWRALFGRMAADGLSDDALVFFGSADEADRSGKLAAAWPGATLNLCGTLSPRESAAAMSRGVVFLGHDSGPMHLASAMGMTCVCMFGEFNKPNTWHPYGARHRILHDMRGVRRVSVDDVYTALGAALAETAAARRAAAILPFVDAARGRAASRRIAT
jgi:heptosyltransferase-3